MKKITNLLFLLSLFVSSAQQQGMYSATNVKTSIYGESEPTYIPLTTSNSEGYDNENVTGSITANLSVSGTGGVQYTVPINVPPGLNGVQPDMAFTYNSQSGNGLAGWGWNVSGISVITRIPTTSFHDNFIDPVDFDINDRFALDGQRLMVKTGNYGSDGSVYQTETYSNAKIVAYGSHPNSTLKGPRYFKVFYPDGSIAHYGRTDNSRGYTDYAISYYENPQGVRISYVYTTSGNTLYLYKIRYGSTSYATGLFEVIFDYTKRKFVETAYIGGVRFVKDKILDKVTVKGIGGTIYRTYALSYSPSSQKYSRLINLYEKSENTAEVRRINFKYNGSSSSGSIYSGLIENKGLASQLDISDINHLDYGTLSLDYTGDGKKLILFYTPLKEIIKIKD